MSMKLQDIHISSSPLTDRIYLGVVSKRDPGAWSSKIDCTAAFLSALMHWAPPGTIRVITDNNGNEFHLQITKVGHAQAQGSKP